MAFLIPPWKAMRLSSETRDAIHRSWINYVKEDQKRWALWLGHTSTHARKRLMPVHPRSGSGRRPLG